jgi:hypothetical protein
MIKLSGISNIYFCFQTNLNIFKMLLDHVQFKGMGPLRMVMTYMPSDAIWHKKQEHIWFRGGGLNGFWDITLPL